MILFRLTFPTESQRSNFNHQRLAGTRKFSANQSLIVRLKSVKIYFFSGMARLQIKMGSIGVWWCY